MQIQNRLRELDFIRGIAIILVIFRHQLLFDFLKTMGWIGVDLFFVLSGFLVSSLLFKEYLKFGSIDPKRFLIRRGFKIYPIFYLTYILYIIPRIILHKPNLTHSFYDLFFIQNYALGWGYTYPASWSLAVEEHFYFGLALFLWLIFNKKLFRFDAVLTNSKITSFEISLIVLLFFVLFLRFFSNIEFPLERARNITMTHLRIDSLLFGVLISFWFHFRLEGLTDFYLKHQTKLLFLALAMLSFTPFIEPLDSFFVKTIGFTMLYVAFGILLIHVLICKNINSQIDKIFSAPVVNYISKIGYCSYSIYIIHALVIYIVDLGQITNHFISFGIVFFLSIFSGFFMTYTLENYFLKYRNKYFPSRTF